MIINFVIDDRTREQILFLAKGLPLTFVNTHEYHIMTKEELDEMGYVGAQKLKDGRYRYKAPVQLAMNHYRRMCRAYQRDGYEGVEAHIDYINKLPNA